MSLLFGQVKDEPFEIDRSRQRPACREAFPVSRITIVYGDIESCWVQFRTPEPLKRIDSQSHEGQVLQRESTSLDEGVLISNQRVDTADTDRSCP